MPLLSVPHYLLQNRDFAELVGVMPFFFVSAHPVEGGNITQVFMKSSVSFDVLQEKDFGGQQKILILYNSVSFFIFSYYMQNLKSKKLKDIHPKCLVIVYLL